MQKLFLLIFLLAFTLLTKAQTSATEHVVYALFEKPDKVQWINHYHGRIDGMSEVTVSVAYDGKRCKGLLTYLRSKEAIQLEGTLKNNLLQLDEINREGKISGSLRGELKEDYFLAEWNNVEENLASVLDLKKVDKEVQTPGHCGENMWIKCFKAQLPQDEMRLIIQAVEEGQLRGIAYSMEEKRSYRILGELDGENDYQLQLQDSEYRKVGKIQGTFTDARRQKAVFSKGGGKDTPMSLKLESHLYMGCKEYADYLLTYDVTYPKTVNTSFNEWMEQEVNQWLKNCREYSASVREVNPVQRPKMRSSIRAYGWSEIDFYSPQLISGYLTYNNTWSLAPQGHSFNYDLQNNTEITLDDIFRKDFEVAPFVLEYLYKKQLQSNWINDPDYREWLKGRDFPFFTIREDGICFCTAYDGVYGRHELTIPYSELKPYIKRRSPIDPFMVK